MSGLVEEREVRLHRQLARVRRVGVDALRSVRRSDCAMSGLVEQRKVRSPRQLARVHRVVVGDSRGGGRSSCVSKRTRVRSMKVGGSRRHAVPAHTVAVTP